MLAFWVRQDGRAWHSHVQGTRFGFRLGGSCCLSSVEYRFWLAGIFFAAEGEIRFASSGSVVEKAACIPPTNVCTIRPPKVNRPLKGCPVAMHSWSASGVDPSGGYKDRAEPFRACTPLSRKHPNRAGLWAVGVHPPSGGHPAPGCFPGAASSFRPVHHVRTPHLRRATKFIRAPETPKTQ